MSNIMSWWGRELPHTPREAFANIRHNACCIGKVLRVVSSVALGIAGVALGASCGTCSNPAVAGNSTDTPSPATTLVTTMVSFNETTPAPAVWGNLETTCKACVVAGVLYGVTGGIIVGSVLVQKYIIPCKNIIKKRQAMNSYTNKSIVEMVGGFLPEVLAGYVGFMYGCAELPVELLREKRDPQWPTTNQVWGNISGGLYVLNAGIAVLDMCCFDVSEIREQEEKEMLLDQQGALIVLEGNGVGGLTFFQDVMGDEEDPVWTGRAKAGGNGDDRMSLEEGAGSVNPFAQSSSWDNSRLSDHWNPFLRGNGDPKDEIKLQSMEGQSSDSKEEDVVLEERWG